MSENICKLSDKQCRACRGDEPALNPEQIEVLVSQLSGEWVVVDNKKLEKTLKFKNFKAALAYVNELGNLAEEQGHHPDIFLAWGKVKITLWTHKIGGLSESDFIFAAKSDLLP